MATQNRKASDCAQQWDAFVRYSKPSLARWCLLCNSRARPLNHTLLLAAQCSKLVALKRPSGFEVLTHCFGAWLARIWAWTHLCWLRPEPVIAVQKEARRDHPNAASSVNNSGAAVCRPKANTRQPRRYAGSKLSTSAEARGRLKK